MSDDGTSAVQQEFAKRSVCRTRLAAELIHTIDAFCRRGIPLSEAQVCDLLTQLAWEIHVMDWEPNGDALLSQSRVVENTVTFCDNMDKAGHTEF